MSITRKRDSFKNDVISVTGTCGKTTTTGMIYVILATKYKLHKTHPDGNGSKGVPHAIQTLLQPTDDIWLIELGIGWPGGMKNLLDIIKPTVKVLTNVGNAHSTKFNSIQQYQQEKLSFLDNLSTTSLLIINNNDPLICKYVTDKIPNTVKIMRCGMAVTDDIQLLTYTLQDDNVSSIAHFNTPNGDLKVILRGIGKACASNAGYAIACGIHYGVPLDSISTALRNFPLYENRGSIHTFKRAIVYNHTYNFVGVAVLQGMEDFSAVKGTNKLIILSPCIFGTRDPQNIVYNSILEAALAITPHVIVFGPTPFIKKSYPEDVTVLTDIKKLLNIIPNIVNNEFLHMYMHTSSSLNANKIPLFKIIESSLKSLLN